MAREGTQDRLENVGSIRLSEEQIEWLRATAAREHRTVPGQIRLLIDRAMSEKLEEVPA